ncbi:IDEAL domain-containing protein [Clostridium sp. Marseille-Q2269]|uniref:IDEAL domain-containing protein n=1 Tax=Clostridium sp. Marseille-Q2269 TaxID=2942205 RepID=UPI002073B390|nr:IDEAL domain-containing protein [Clostridium sp. Marseille-Q2269]
MEVKYMEIFDDECNRLTYCTEVTTAKSLNKSTDKIKVFYYKYVTGESYFDFYFGRTYDGKLIENKFYMFKEDLKVYIHFLHNFYNVIKTTLIKQEDIKHFFLIKGQGEVSLSLIGQEYVKLTSEDNNKIRVFFILNKDELSYYIKLMENIYYERNIINELDYLKNPLSTISSKDYIKESNEYSKIGINKDYILSQKEKNNVCLQALYAFIDEALDRKDEQAFHSICDEMEKYNKK